MTLNRADRSGNANERVTEAAKNRHGDGSAVGLVDLAGERAVTHRNARQQGAGYR